MKNFVLAVLLVLIALVSTSSATTYTFGIASSAYSADFKVLVMKMTNTNAYGTDLSPMQMFVWDSAEGLAFTKSTTTTATGPIRVFAVGVDVKIYKDVDLTNYWLIKSNTSDQFKTR